MLKFTTKIDDQGETLGVNASSPNSLMVIIGDNGAGKTRLLQELRSSQTVEVDSNVIHSSQITFVPTGQILQRKMEANSGKTRRIDERLLENMDKAKASLKEAMDVYLTREAGEGLKIDIDDLVGSDLGFEEYCDKIGFKTKLNDFLKVQISNEPTTIAWPNLVNSIAGQGAVQRLQQDIDFVLDILRRPSDEGVRVLQSITLTAGHLFQAPIAERFAKYNAEDVAHTMETSRQNEGGETLVSSEEKAEFRRVYGVPPWQILNDVFREIGFDFKVLAPDPSDFSKQLMQLRFLDTRSGAVVAENQLSAGEKVIFALSSILMFERDKQLVIANRQLVFLDEPEVFLHPRFIDIMMQLLTKSLELGLVGGDCIDVALSDCRGLGSGRLRFSAGEGR